MYRDADRNRQANSAWGLDRPFLHCYRIGIQNPGTGRKLRFTAPVPEDLNVILQDLGLEGVLP